jgi:hypothetical protein
MSSAPIRLQGSALTLGASSGFGEAATRAFAEAGLDVFGVHLDKKATLGHVERIVADLRGLGRLVVLAHPDTHWITGNMIGVDGGEDIVG